MEATTYITRDTYGMYSDDDKGPGPPAHCPIDRWGVPMLRGIVE